MRGESFGMANLKPIENGELRIENSSTNSGSIRANNGYVCENNSQLSILNSQLKITLCILMAIGVLTSCMQLEYIEAPDEFAWEESSSSEVELSSSSDFSSSSSLEDVKLQMWQYELEHRGISYYEAILICNKMSLEEGLDTLYSYDKPVFVDELFWLPNLQVLENRSGYRLPTKAEWLSAWEKKEIKKNYENVGEWLYETSGSQYSSFELAPHFLRTVGLYKEREGYPVYGMRVVKAQF
ncbi:MAG: hypothetical protein LBU89_03440 [Fibromonadaceae bacterium]|nr:hypothetical protein [Fibromonadaceae bacterium]